MDFPCPARFTMTANRHIRQTGSVPGRGRVAALACLSVFCALLALVPVLRRQVAAPPPPSPAMPTATPSPETLRLNTIASEPENAGLAIPAAHERPSARGYPWMVVFDSPIQPDWKTTLQQHGARIQAYLPDHALLVEAPADALPQLSSSIPHVVWTGEYRPGHKIERRLLQLAQEQPQQAHPVSFQTFMPEDTADVIQALRTANATDIQASRSPRWGFIRATLPPDGAIALAALPEIQWMEAVRQPFLCNDVARSADNLDIDGPALAAGLDGSGQIITVADTGLDRGSLTQLHPDFAGRIVFATNIAGGSTWSDGTYHGTHVAATALGDGSASSGQFHGVAPAAGLIVQSAITAQGILDFPDNLGLILGPAYDLGARVHNNSWAYGDEYYYLMDQTADEFIWDHPDMVMVCAAGNSGVDANRDGVIDSASLVSPASAKNVLAVGASESGRPSGSGGKTAVTHYQAWGTDYSVDPIRSDLVSSPPAGNPQGLVGFSSRGPLHDGRNKPDVVAPGTDIISARSRGSANTGWGIYSGNTNYCFMGGTSMAAPMISGMAALFRQHYMDTLQRESPSAALIKAALLGGARSLHPGQYGTGAYQEIPDGARPNNVEGWGQANLAATLFPAEPLGIVLREGPALAIGEEHLFSFSVLEPDTPLTVVMAYSDYPSHPDAAINLVNDLDLVLVAPDGTRLHPNGLPGADRLNNVEGVDVATAQTGRWTAVVSAYNTPLYAQPFALYARGNIHAPPQIIHEPPAYEHSAETGYVLEAKIIAQGFWKTNSLVCVASSSDAPEFEQVLPMTSDDGIHFTTTLAPKPAGIIYSYYLLAETEDGQATTHPETAPAVRHTFTIRPAIQLDIAGYPSNLFVPQPNYGTHFFASNSQVSAQAPAAVEDAGRDGYRTACTGWLGGGSVPASGQTNALDFVIEADSILTWQWQEQVQVRVDSSPADLLNETLWFPPGTAVTSPWAAPEMVLDSNGQPYIFAGWNIGGTRWPDAASVSPRQLTGLVPDAPMTATADYLPEDEDTDGNGLPDWFELRYFGQLQQNRFADPDGDGYTNLEEAQDHSNPLDPLSTPEAPVIFHTPPESPVTNHFPFAITASVTDNFQVASVVLRWQRNQALARSITMSPVGGDVYQAMLPLPAMDADVFTYSIQAVDAAGYETQSPAYSFTLSCPHLDTTDIPAFINMTLPRESQTNTILHWKNIGSGDLVLRIEQRTAVFFDDVESGTNGWTRIDPDGIWNITSNRWNSAGHSWYCGEDIPGLPSYPNDAHASLVSPPITLPAAAAGWPAALHFIHFVKMETDEETAQGNYWDSGIMEISTDDGATWAPLAPDGGYPAVIIDNPASPFAPGTPCFANTDGWQPVTAALAAYAGRTIRLRFRFGSDSYVVNEGWWIDDIHIAPRAAYSNWLHLSTQAAAISSGQTASTTLAFETTPLPCMAVDYQLLLVHHNDPLLASPLLIPITLLNSTRRIEITASGPGAVNPSGEFFYNAESIPLALTPDAGAFIADAQTNGVYAASAPVGTPAATNWTVPLPDNMHIALLFAAIPDADQIPPADWLEAYGLTNRPPMAEAVLDPDGDGLLTWQEYELDSDPVNADDAPFRIHKLLPMDRDAQTQQFIWHAVTNTNAVYTILRSTHLPDGAEPIEDMQLPAAPPVMTSPPLPVSNGVFYGIEKRSTE